MVKIDITEDEDSQKRTVSNNIRRIDALISYYFHIPFPEELSDSLWMEKYRQIEWLVEIGIIGTEKIDKQK